MVKFIGLLLSILIVLFFTIETTTTNCQKTIFEIIVDKIPKLINKLFSYLK